MLGALRPASFPFPAPSFLTLYSTPSSSGSSNDDPTPNDNQPFADGATNRVTSIGEPPFSRDSMSPSLGSECCGGFVDCTNLAEEEQDELQENHHLAPVPGRLPECSSTSMGCHSIK